MAERSSALRRVMLVALLSIVLAPTGRAADKVVIGQTAANDYLPAIVAKDKGFFAAHDVDAEIMIPPQPTAIFGGITSGSVQIGTSTGPQLALAAEAGAELVVIAGGAFETKAHPSIKVVASPAANIHSAADFRGRKVVTPGINSVYHVMFQRWLVQQGVDPKSVTYLEAGFPQMADMLHANLVDAALPTDPFTSQIIGSGSGVSVAEYFVSVKDDAFVTFYVGTKTWAIQHQAAIKGFRAALADGFAFIADHRDEAKAIEAKALKLPPGVLDKLGPPNARLDASAADLQFWFDTSKSLGLITSNLDAKGMMAP